MGAIAYEHMIRKVYGCARTEMYGADAEIYTRMDKLYQELQAQFVGNREDQRFREYFTVVRGYVLEALNTLYRTHSPRLSEADSAFINRMRNEMGQDFYDKERLDQVVLAAGEILNRYNGD